MAEGDDAVYDKSVQKLSFGNFVEFALRTTTNREKRKIASNFVDTHSRQLYDFKCKAYQLVVNSNKYINDNINQFAALQDLDSSRQFIYNHMNLISPSTINYLKSWLMDLESDDVRPCLVCRFLKCL